MLLHTPSVSGVFKWRQFEPEVILLAVGWYLRFSLSYRDVEELLAERGLTLDFTLSANQDAGAAKRFLAKALGSTEPFRPACHQHRWACGLPARDRSAQE